MTSTRQRAESAFSEGSASQLAKARKKKKEKTQYTSVFELVTQDKKKLLITSVNNLEPPQGYTFVHNRSTGGLVQRCLEQCRLQGLLVFSVFRGALIRNEVSEQTRRIGYHIPTRILERASEYLGYLPDPQRHGVFKPGYTHVPLVGMIAERLEVHREKEDHERIALTIREMFPNIPEDAIQPIINRAFESGTKRVGTAKDLSLPDRVGLAVGAHVRHVHTDYDTLLNVFTWQESRKAVASDVIKKLKQWRGELQDEDRAIEKEDIFREVIVIDDDDDSDERGTSAGNSWEESDDDIQFIEKPTATQKGRERDRDLAAPPAQPVTSAHERHDMLPVVDEYGIRRYVRIIQDDHPPLSQQYYPSRNVQTMATQSATLVPIETGRGEGFRERLAFPSPLLQHYPKNAFSHETVIPQMLPGKAIEPKTRQSDWVEARPALAERNPEDVPLPSVEQPPIDARLSNLPGEYLNRKNENILPVLARPLDFRTPHTAQQLHQSSTQNVRPVSVSKRKSWPNPIAPTTTETIPLVKRQRLENMANHEAYLGPIDSNVYTGASPRQAPRRIVSEVIDLTSSPHLTSFADHEEFDALSRSPRGYVPKQRSMQYYPYPAGDLSLLPGPLPRANFEEKPCPVPPAASNYTSEIRYSGSRNPIDPPSRFSNPEPPVRHREVYVEQLPTRRELVRPITGPDVTSFYTGDNLNTQFNSR